MSSNREITINNNKIEEYYWAGGLIVYVNNNLSDMNYEECIEFYNK